MFLKIFVVKDALSNGFLIQHDSSSIWQLLVEVALAKVDISIDNLEKADFSVSQEFEEELIVREELKRWLTFFAEQQDLILNFFV